MADAGFMVAVKRAREGDEEAWRELIGCYEPQLLRLAKRLIGPQLRQEFDPADLVQMVHHDIWLELKRGRYQLEHPSMLLGLARVILRREVSRSWRQFGRRQGRLVRQPCRLDWLPGCIGEVGAECVLAEELQRLSRVLNTAERQLLGLRLLGYSTAEAGLAMGRSPDALRVVLCRLRRKCLARL